MTGPFKIHVNNLVPSISMLCVEVAFRKKGFSVEVRRAEDIREDTCMPLATDVQFLTLLDLLRPPGDYILLPGMVVEARAAPTIVICEDVYSRLAH